MNKQTLVRAGLWLVFGLGAVPAFAQAVVKAKVPFDFVVPGKVLLSGEYTLIIRPHQLMIQDGYGRPLMAVLANDAYRQSAGQKGRMVFRCYRNRCFLAQVWAPGHDHGIEFHLSRTETQMTKAQSGTLFALIGEKPKP